MTTVLLVIAVAAALACPAHMLWQRRRGKSAGCLPAADAAETLRRRQGRLAEQLAELRRQRG